MDPEFNFPDAQQTILELPGHLLVSTEPLQLPEYLLKQVPAQVPHLELIKHPAPPLNLTQFWHA